jgi:peptidoglycan DL-endopeptidase CwlO
MSTSDAPGGFDITNRSRQGSPAVTGSPLRRLLIALLVVGLGVVVLPSTAGASPKPSLNQVQHRVDTLNRQAAAAAERYNTARVDFTDAQREMRSAQNRYGVARQHLDAMKTLVGRIAVASYKSGGMDPSVQLLLASDPTEFLRRAADLGQVTRRQAATIRGLEAARLDAAVDRKSLADQKARAQALQQKIAAEKSVIEAHLSQARNLLSSLEAKQRARLEAMRQAAVGRALNARSSALRADRSSRGNDFPTYDGPASGRAAVAVKTAYAQLGDPYVWGAAGPSSFDCSGLTMYSWNAAGVSLPHSSSAQYGSVQHVAISDLQPGDLVFYYSPISHVGIYIGGGRIIDAPYPGLSVHISGLYSMPLAGAGRP